MEVFRRDSKKLPIGDPEIDWEETIYVNMIIHHFDYHLTLAVCTRTSPRELQVLKRHTEVSARRAQRTTCGVTLHFVVQMLKHHSL